LDGILPYSHKNDFKVLVETLKCSLNLPYKELFRQKIISFNEGENWNFFELAGLENLVFGATRYQGNAIY
jgi:hypothetical protein